MPLCSKFQAVLTKNTKKVRIGSVGRKPHNPPKWRYNANVNVPPPFSPPQAAPPKKTNTALILGIVLACILIPCIGLIVVGAMGFNFVKNTIGPMATCAIAFEHVRNATLDYAKDHNGKLPKAETWQDDVRPYYEKTSKNTEDLGPFEAMKPDGDWGCKTGNSMTGMAFNSELSGKKVEDIKDPYSTVLIFEIESAMKNAHQPFKVRSDSSSPKLMGEPRGWMEMMVQGGMKGLKSKNGRSFEFKAGTSSGSEDSK